MKQNDKMTLVDCIKICKNIFLTGDSKTDFQYTKDKQDENAALKNSIKTQKIYFIGIFGLVFLIFMVIGAAAIMYSMGKITITLMKIISIICCAGIFTAGWRFVKLIKHNTKQYSTDIVEKAIHSVLPEAEIQSRGCINAQKLYHMGIIPDFTDTSGSYLISYKMEDRINYFSNLRLDYDTSQRDTSGKVITTFEGQVYVLNSRKCISGCVRIIVGKHNGSSLSWFYKQGKDEVKIRSESVVFNENFTVFATNEQEAFCILTPYVMEQLLNIKNKYGTFGMSISKDEIAIALNTGYTLFVMPQDYTDIEKISVENVKLQVQGIFNFGQMIENLISSDVNNQY